MKKTEQQKLDDFLKMSRAIRDSRLSHKTPVKINPELVLDMSQYTEEGKADMRSLAATLQKLYSVVPEEDFTLFIDLINGGHSLEIIDLSNAITKANK